MIDVSTANPFVGLRPYRSDESLLFFGRRQQTSELLTELYKTHFLAVVGSSGCGKSSLIQAGLIPHLTAGFLVENRDLWTFRILTPGGAPRSRLAATFGLATHDLLEQGAAAIVDRLAVEPDAASKNCLLLVDQFEEIFSFIDSIANRDEAADFVGILLALAAQRDFPVFVVLTMRSDFLGDCDIFYGLPEAINQSHYLVPRLTRVYRQEVIEAPIRLFGRTITPQLVDRVLNDLGDDQDQLPVMQHALLRTWECWRRSGGQGPVDLSHYLAVGGVKEALWRDADAALDGLSEQECRLAIQIFQALTDTDVNNRPVRRYARLSELERETGASRDAIHRIVERFRESGRSFLVVRQELDGNDPTIYISHESLIRQWGRLVDWVQNEKESRDHYLRLVDLAQRHARGEEGLLRDPGLQLALDWRQTSKPSEAWAKRYRDDFALAMSFLDASEGQRDKERVEKEQQQRLQLDLAEERGRSRARARLSWIAGALAIIALGFAAVAIQRTVKANHQTDLANSSRLALHARTHADRELDLAMLWSVEAFRRAPTFEAWSGLLTLVGRRPHPSRFLHGHSGPVRAVAFAPDGKLAASTGDDATVNLWNVETGQAVPLEVSPKWAQSLAFGPDGRVLAAGGRDGKIVLWNLATREVDKTLPPIKEGVRSIAFSPDGDRLAAGANDGRVVVWQHLRSAGDGEETGAAEPFTLTRGTSDVHSVAFDARGTLLASGHWDGTVFLWDPQNRTFIRELRGHADAVKSLAFSSDGRSLASGSDDRTIAMWDLHTLDRPPLRVTGHQGRVQSVSISDDGKLLASGSDDRTVRLWDIRWEPSNGVRVTPRALPLTGHGSLVQSVAFSPGGTQLISGGWDNKVILWDLNHESLLDRLHRDPDGKAIENLAWSAHGRSLASIREDQQVSLWHIGSPNAEVAQRASSFDGRIMTLGFDRDGALVWSGVRDKQFSTWAVDAQRKLASSTEIPDGEDTLALAVSSDRLRLAYGTRSNEIVVWDVPANRKQYTLHTDLWVDSLAFSLDGALLASSWGNTIVLWDLRTGKELDRLTHHDFADTVTGLAFNYNGTRLAASTDNRIFMWDVPTRQLLGVLLTPRKGIRTVAYSPQGEYLAAGDDNGTIRIWDLSADALQRAACRTANSELPPKEWEAIVGPETPYRKTCGR